MKSLKQFGTSVSKRYGIIHPDLLQSLYKLYSTDKDKFQEDFFYIDVVKSKCLYSLEIDEDFLVIFGEKYLCPVENTIKFKGDVVAKNKESIFNIGSHIELDSCEKVEPLTSTALIEVIDMKKLITEDNG